MILNSSKPEYSIYYIGGVLLNIINENDSLSILELYDKYKLKVTKYANFNYFLLSIDWLYLIDAIDIEDGYLKCI